MSAFRVFFFILSSCLVSSIVLAKEARFHKEVDPVGNTYIHEVLKNVRMLSCQSRALPYGVSHFIKRLEVNLEVNKDHIGVPGTLDVHLPFPWAMINLGLNIKHIPYYEGIVDYIVDSFRGNLIVGNLYKYPVFLRVGYDYIPFGRHVSQIITAQEIITQADLSEREVLVSVGGDYEMSQARMKGSVTYLPISTGIKVVANIQYEQDAPISLFDFGTLDRFIMGGGFGAGWCENSKKGLFNLYSDIDFLNEYNCRFEYVYNAMRSALFEESSPHALYFEGSKRFSSKPYQLPMVKWHVYLPTIVCGYERGITESLKLKSDLFFALKIEVWDHRIVLAGGPRWSFEDNTPSVCFRAGISL